MDIFYVFILMASFGYGQGFILATNNTGTSAWARRMNVRSFFGVGATTAAPPESDAPFDLIITGIADRENSLGDLLELYVVRNIPDLSEYALGTANNGGGSDGMELTFPANSHSAGDFIYVRLGSTDLSFFGVTEDYNFVNLVTGNDAIELFQNNMVIDVFGEVSIDATGTAFDHNHGWAYRVNGAHQSTTFIIGDWTFSGTNVLNGLASNSASSSPFPVGTYSP